MRVNHLQPIAHIVGTLQCEHMERSKQKVAIYVMSLSKIKRTLLESGLGLLAKEYEKNHGHTLVHDNMVPWALRALGTKKDKNFSPLKLCSVLFSP